MITLTSDFGLRDPYVAEMKGVILSINPEAKLIDITHDVKQFDIRMGAFMLASAAPYFPKGTVHVAIIDPEVGTDRRAILIETERGFFVGPDNGVLMLAAQNQKIQQIREITNSQFMLPRVSNTFHGRDIFSPSAAYLEKGVSPSQFGAEIANPTWPNFAEIKYKKDVILGEVLHVDDFGNIITNIPEQEPRQKQIKGFSIVLRRKMLNLKFSKTYGNGKFKEAVAIIGSHGYLEIALNQGNAAEEFSVTAGDEISVSVVR
jgi:S-adenosyl-L-methionine hydrolase (adenosine-forming)